MKYLLALDSYKNCMDSLSVAQAVARGIQQKDANAIVDILPVADGGEGSVHAVCYQNSQAQLCQESVSGPIGKTHFAEYAWFEKTQMAWIELANICGIELLPGKHLDVMRASSFGVGEMLLKLYHRGIYHFGIGIGGSASCDGGVGLLQALGAQFYNKEHQLIAVPAGGGDLKKIEFCDLTNLQEFIQKTNITIFSDVTNPLLGLDGTAAVFAPQKGADAKKIVELEDGLSHYYNILKFHKKSLECTIGGDGAAGGVGFALRGILNGKIVSGASEILSLAQFQQRLLSADCVITGEGRSDSQTLHGKLPVVIAEKAREQNKIVILLSGAVLDMDHLLPKFDAVFSIASGPGSLEDALANTAENLYAYGLNIASLLTSSKLPIEKK